MAHSTSSTTHRLLRSLLASCWLFSPLLVADATPPQHSALATALSDARLASWLSLLDNSAGDEEREQLERVNHFINRSISFVSDQQAWGADDYWATPAQTLKLGKGTVKILPSPNTSAWCAWGSPAKKCA